MALSPLALRAEIWLMNRGLLFPLSWWYAGVVIHFPQAGMVSSLLLVVVEHHISVTFPPGPHPAVHYGVVPYGSLLAMGSSNVPTKALSYPALIWARMHYVGTGLWHWSSKIMKGEFGDITPPYAFWIIPIYLFSLSGLSLGKRKVGTCVSAWPFSYFLNTPGRRSGRFSSLEPESLG